jgi:HEAT repeat protein
MIRLKAQTANDLIGLTRGAAAASTRQVLKELVANHIILRKKAVTKVNPHEFHNLIRRLEELTNYSREVDVEKDVKAIERLAELGDPQALDVLTRVSRHLLIDIKFAAKDAIEKIKNANR